MSVRCVVFDIDDTLYLERDYVRSGFHAVGDWAAVHLGASGFAEAAWRLFEEGVRGDTFDRALCEVGATATGDTITQMVEVYRKHRPTIRLLEDAATLINHLNAEGLAMAAISDGSLDSQRRKAEALGLRRWLSHLVFTGSWGGAFRKPHERAYREVESAMNAGGDTCFYIADNPAKDFVAPATLGWRTFRVRRPQSLHASAASGDDVQAEAEDLLPVLALLGLTPGQTP